MLRVPKIWYSLGEYIHQDFLEQFPDFYMGLKDFLSEESEKDILGLKVYLVALLKETDGIVCEHWNNSGAMIGFDSNTLRRHLSRICEDY